MAVSGENVCLSKPVSVYGEPELCNPTADPNGPYSGCVNEPITLDGSGSTALAGTIVAWDWDLDNDGEYDDAFGEFVGASFDTPGLYDIGLRVTSSDSLTLTSESSTTVQVDICQQVCGDLDNDGDVDGDDRNILRGAFRTMSGDPGFIEEADYDGDGDIDFIDYQRWYQCYESFSSRLPG
jgi:hypothetical protein